MVDPKKIDETLRLLNNTEEMALMSTGKWVEASGYQMLHSIEVKDNKLVRVPNSATPIKIFFNSETGEIRPFLAAHFDADVEAVPPPPKRDEGLLDETANA